MFGTRFASTRVTEGFPGAFQPKTPTSDTGTRIIARYSNFPPGARLFVPTLVAGSDALQPTAAGDLGGTPPMAPTLRDPDRCCSRWSLEQTRTEPVARCPTPRGHPDRPSSPPTQSAKSR